jgi:hypothetical protein
MKSYAVFVNMNDGRGWVRAFKKNYTSPVEAETAGRRKSSRVWVLAV